MKQEMSEAEDADDMEPEDEYSADAEVEERGSWRAKMGELRVENGLLRFIGGTSHLIYLGDPPILRSSPSRMSSLPNDEPIDELD